MVSITKNHYELQIEGETIRLIYFTDTMLGLKEFKPVNSPEAQGWLKKFNKAQPRTSFTPQSFPSENLHIYEG